MDYHQWKAYIGGQV